MAQLVLPRLIGDGEVGADDNSVTPNISWAVANGRWVKIPVGAPLKAMLDWTQRVATVIVTTSNSAACTEDGFRASWGKACTKGGHPGRPYVPRYTRVGRDAPGRGLWEVPEIATITGALAVPAVAKLERAANRSRTKIGKQSNRSRCGWG